MDTDGFPPGMGMEPDDGMSWDDDAVKSTQEGRLDQAQSPLTCNLDSSQRRCSRNRRPRLQQLLVHQERDAALQQQQE